MSDTVNYFSPVLSKLCGSPQDSGRDNPYYESLLVVEVQETSENPMQSLITSAKEVMFSPEFVCLSVSNITRKVVDGFR